MAHDPDAVHRILRWPPRPPVQAGRVRYETVRAAALREILGELEAWIFAQEQLTPAERDRLFARAAAAAAVNALLDP